VPVRAGDPIGDANNRRHEGGDDHGADDRGCAVGDKAQRCNDRAQPQHQEEPVRGDRIAIHLCV